jgi:anti-anti-sigma factor
LIEDKEAYLRAIEQAGTPASTVRLISELDSSIGLQEIRTEGTRAALAGETGTRMFPDYRDVSVLSSFKPLNIPDSQWVIMSEIDEAEAFGPARALRNQVLATQLVLVLVILGVAVLFSRTLTRPLNNLSMAAGKLAAGEMETAIETSRVDEIGELSRSFDAMRQSLRQLLRKQSDAIDALSVPLIPLHEDIVVVPLVGELDAHRVEKFRNGLVAGLHKSEKRVAIIDITGVPSMDQEVAKGLVRVAQSVRLLGAQVVLTGMQPGVAEKLADLDLHFEGLVPQRSLQSGIDLAMKLIGSSENPERLEG